MAAPVWRALLAVAVISFATPAAAQDPLELAMARMDQGQTLAAAELFEQLFHTQRDASAALLGGICRYELGQGDKARPLLLAARADPAHRSTADLFLGLIALDAGERQAAYRLFSASREDASSAISRPASDLARLSARAGKLSLILGAEGRYDSNLTLAPDGATASPRIADLGGQLAGDLVFRPMGESGLFASVSGRASGQLRESEFNAEGGAFRVGLQLGPDRLNVQAAYRQSFEALGSDPFLWQHEGRATARAMLGRFTARGSYRYIQQRYLLSAIAGYTGPYQEGVAAVEWRATDALALDLQYLGGLRAAADPLLSTFEHGPSPSLRIRVTSNVDLKLDGAFVWRWYTAQGGGALDRIASGNAALTFELDDHFTLRAFLNASRVFSEDATRASSAVSGGLGLTYSAAVL